MADEAVGLSANRLVSVGIPTRNRAPSLRRAVESVLAQDWEPLEVVISDNASTDETERLCEELARADRRVRYVRHPENVGPVANFREALHHARGELFMWLADDDWIDRSYVSACANALFTDAESVLVCGRAHYYRGGEFAFAERPVNLLGSSGWRRVVGFYRTVTLNGPFYGVTRRAALESLPLSQFDWLLVAALAYLGKIRTLDGVSIHRSLEGSSQDAAALARSLGLSPRQERNWQLVVARAAFDDLVRGPVYGSSVRAKRYAVAAAAWLLVVMRFSGKVWLGRWLIRAGWFARARAALEALRRRRG